MCAGAFPDVLSPLDRGSKAEYRVKIKTTTKLTNTRSIATCAVCSPREVSLIAEILPVPTVVSVPSVK
jgi:hypothetical protein